MLASVCRETRAFTLRYGHRHLFRVQGSEEAIWIQPRLDTLNLYFQHVPNSFPGMCQTVSTRRTDLYDSVAEALELNMPISLPTVAIDEFYINKLKAIVKWEEQMDRLGGHPDRDCYPYPSVAESFLTSDTTIILSITSIYFRISHQQARESGLFGHLGDAPVQIVPCNDQKRMKRFAEAYKRYSLADTDDFGARTMQGATNQIGISKAGHHVADAEKSLLVQLWMLDYLRGRLDKETCFDMWDEKQNVTSVFDVPQLSWLWTVFDESHPWVQDARRRLVKFKPVVTFRHCARNCHLHWSDPAPLTSTQS